MVLAFIVPLLIALATAGAVLLPVIFLPRQAPARLGLLMLAGLGIGFLAGSASMLPGWWVVFPPPDSTVWILFSWPVFALLGMWQSAKGSKLWLNALLRLLPGLLYAWLVLAPMRLQGWNPILTFAIASAFGLGLALSAGPLEKSADRNSPPWLYAALALILFTASCPIFLLGSSAMLTQQAAMLALLQLIPLALLIQKPDIPVNGLLGLNSFGLAALWLNAWLFSDTKPWSACLLLLSLSPLLLHWQPVARLRPGLRYSLVLGLCVLSLMALVTILWLKRSQDLYFG